MSKLFVRGVLSKFPSRFDLNMILDYNILMGYLAWQILLQKYDVCGDFQKNTFREFDQFNNEISKWPFGNIYL